jgi:hypothetical protein
MPSYTPENQRNIEYMILLLLGSSKEKRLSVLHIEKELFILQRASNQMKELYLFIEHYRGPYSKEIYDAIISPMFLEDVWDYEESEDDLSGGYVELNEQGMEEFKKLLSAITSKKNEKLIEILAAMDIIHDLYDRMAPRELLYVVYTSPEYKNYIRRSIVYDEVVTDRTKELLRKRMSQTTESGA